MHQRTRWPFLIATLLALLGGSALPGLLSPSHTAAMERQTETQIIQFHPATDLNATAAGNCWTNSLAAARADAWRCMVGNIIYDPCFEMLGARQSRDVVCDSNPATGRKGIQVNVTQPFPKADQQRSMETQAWLLLLSNGAYCSFLTGATGEVNHMRINYGCSDASTVIGMPTKGKVWMVQSQPQGGGSLMSLPVKMAWL